ncbi:HigA family addiction module antitoxin [Desulfococcaceae bacterium HSG9]|nr:HigA family addiction module antitoxin [Desulfococcaceae bacterium HSG9]
MTEMKIPPIHPGEILKEDFLLPMNISESKLSAEIKLKEKQINNIIKNKASINANVALRLGIYFGTGAQFWLKLQMKYDIAIAEDQLEDLLKNEIRPVQNVAYV